ncbi:MAG: hypothetical protein R3C45_20850 [Phycisphaerales bacterium]
MSGFSWRLAEAFSVAVDDAGDADAIVTVLFLEFDHEGMAAMHGPHRVAQKSMTAILPLRSSL